MYTNIIDKIISVKKREIKNNKILNSIKKLENSIFFNRKIFSLKKNIKNNKYGIIAEFKLKSPSKGKINYYSSLEEVIKGYDDAKVSGISVLTDNHFFSGSIENIKKSRFITSIPLLRKDFIIDEYQIIESKSIGADVILLIASFLSKKEIKNYSSLAKSIGLEVIIEIHKEEEIKKISYDVDFIGVNNRNLKTFHINETNCLKLISKIPNKYIKIAESGINSIKNIIELKKKGYMGFLIGEYFMKSKNPGEKCKIFMNSLMKNGK